MKVRALLLDLCLFNKISPTWSTENTLQRWDKCRRSKQSPDFRADQREWKREASAWLDTPHTQEEQQQEQQEGEEEEEQGKTL